MRARELAKFKGLLETKRAELAEGFESARTRTVEGAEEEDKDYIDYAVSSYTKEFLFSLSDLERKQLIQVEQALLAIDEGNYGKCEPCDEVIDDKRLKAVPWAKYCVECQELYDRGLLQVDDDDDEDEDD